MTRVQARREALRIVALLIENYFDVGQPFTGCDERTREYHTRHRVDGDPEYTECRDCTKLYNELAKIKLRLEARSDT